MIFTVIIPQLMLQFIKSLIQKEIWFERFARKHVLMALGVAIVLGLAGGFLLRGGKTEEVASDTRVREVSIASVAELSGVATNLPLVGTVTSQSEASINAESAGEIVAIYRKLGDMVSAGTVIAEIENSRERASLLQAQASLASAKANLSIGEVGGNRDLKSLEEAKNSALNAIRSAYDVADDSVRIKLDVMFSNPRSANPQFNIVVSDSQLPIDINFKRLSITDTLHDESVRIQNLTSLSDLSKEISLAEADLRSIKDFTDKVITALSQGVASQSISQTTIDTYKTTAITARASINASISALSSARDSLNSKTAQAEISKQQTGSGNVTLSTSEAAIKQAEASVRLAQVSLEKSLIRSPISGTINSFSLKRGDFVSMYQPVAVISNNGSLEVVSYITEEDAAYVTVGSKALIQDSVSGVITRVAPALDPKTKKIEVRIGIVGASNLINGQTVSLSITRAPRNSASSKNTPLSVPISALKITPAGSFVFTVDENGLLVAHTVKEGLLLGDRIAIAEGLTGDMRIVTDARGLKEGMKVTLKTN